MSTPNLPKGMKIDVVLSSLLDKRGLRAALTGVESVIHLAGEEKLGYHPNLMQGEIYGTQNLAEAAAEVGVQRFLFVSHLGASRTSAYALQRGKAFAEEHILRSGVPYTILRSAIVFGEEDRFTTSLAMMLSVIPLIFPIPGAGDSLVQPIWVEDLVTAILWSLSDPETKDQIYNVGGPEYLTFRQVVEAVMLELGIRRFILPMLPPYLRAGTWLFERVIRVPPVTTFWLDYLAVHRTADLHTMPGALGIQPSRLEPLLGYLRHENWVRRFFSNQWRPLQRAA
jgi:NADH dehydrogenase